MRGQQVEQRVIAGVGGVEGEQRNELRQPPLVRGLRGERAQRSAGVDARIGALGAPVVEQRADGRPVATCEIRQALVGEDVPLTLAERETEAPQRPQQLVRAPVAEPPMRLANCSVVHSGHAASRSSLRFSAPPSCVATASANSPDAGGVRAWPPA